VVWVANIIRAGNDILTAEILESVSRPMFTRGLVVLPERFWPSIRHFQPPYLARLCAKRDANTDFSRALSDAVGGHGIHADER
jgi:hypothetical protein